MTTSSARLPGTVAQLCERSVSQTTRAQLEIRELIVRGVLPPGTRVTELHMVELLGVSRTPVRTALLRLQQEGLLDPLPGGGFSVRVFTRREVFEAIEVRGTLEGLAARLAAERDPRPAELAGLAGCLVSLDALFAGEGRHVDLSRYADLNAEFHRRLVSLASGPVLARQLDLVIALPLASPNALAAIQADPGQALAVLTVAQEQHRCVVEAIERREGARAEAIMREHARISSRNLHRAFQQAANDLPGGIGGVIAWG